MIKPYPAGPVSWISVDQMRDIERVANELGLDPYPDNEERRREPSMAREQNARRRGLRPPDHGPRGTRRERRRWPCRRPPPDWVGRGRGRGLGLGSGRSRRRDARAAALAGPDGGIDRSWRCGLGHTELFIDAILGFGQHGNPRGDAAALVAARADSTVLSLDVPTVSNSNAGSSESRQFGPRLR